MHDGAAWGWFGGDGARGAHGARKSWEPGTWRGRAWGPGPPWGWGRGGCATVRCPLRVSEAEGFADCARGPARSRMRQPRACAVRMGRYAFVAMKISLYI